MECQAYAREKAVAVEAGMEAARLCLTAQAEMPEVGQIEKYDSSPVTVADYCSQALICRRLASAAMISRPCSRVLPTAPAARI